MWGNGRVFWGGAGEGGREGGVGGMDGCGKWEMGGFFGGEGGWFWGGGGEGVWGGGKKMKILSKKFEMKSGFFHNFSSLPSLPPSPPSHLSHHAVVQLCG